MPIGVGIELATDGMVIAIAEQGHDLIKVKHLKFIPNSEKERLPSLLKSSTLASCPLIYISLPAGRAILRKFRVPFTQPAQIEQIIQYETERYIPASSPIEELIVDFHILNHEAESSRLLIAALRRIELQQTLAELEKMGIYPLGVELDILALFHTWQATQAKNSQGFFILMDVRKDFCNLLLVSKDQIQEARAIPIVSHSLMDGVFFSISETTEINPEMAQPTKLLTPESKTRIFRHLLKEVRRTVLSTQTVEGIYICGESEIFLELPEFLSPELTLPVFRFDISTYLEIAPEVQKNVIPASPVAIGLALKSLSLPKGGFNFRKEGFAYQKSFAIVKRPLAITATLVLWLSLVLGISVYIEKNQKSREYDDLLAQVQTVYFRVKTGDSLDAIPYFARVKHVKEEIKERVESSLDRLPKIHDALWRWSLLFDQLAPVRSQYYFTVEHLVLDQQEAILEGRTESDLFFDLLKRKLLQLPWVFGMQVLSSKLEEAPKNPKLPRQYKVLLSLRE
jgi:Tfp pilus assembly PilM family ATPase